MVGKRLGTIAGLAAGIAALGAVEATNVEAGQTVLNHTDQEKTFLANHQYNPSNDFSAEVQAKFALVCEHSERYNVPENTCYTEITATDSEAKEFLNEIIRKGQKQLEKKLVLVDTNNSKNVDDV